MLLNISVLQLHLCVFAFLHLRNCSRSAIEASFIALTYSQLCIFAFLHFCKRIASLLMGHSAVMSTVA